MGTVGLRIRRDRRRYCVGRVVVSQLRQGEPVPRVWLRVVRRRPIWGELEGAGRWDRFEANRWALALGAEVVEVER